MAILITILILVALVLVHEAGHFFAAKFFGIRVDEFSIGFRPRLFSVRRGETEYSFNLLLFGGFVRIFGEYPEEGQADPRSLLSKSRFVQAAVVVAGILMNLFFALVLFTCAYLIGVPQSVDPSDTAALAHAKLTVVVVMPGSPADKAGFRSGDVIDSMQTGIASLPFPASAAAARDFIGAHQEESVIVGIDRGAKHLTLLAHPEAGVVADEPDRKAIGVEFADVGVQRLSLLPAIAEGGKSVWEDTILTARGLAGFFGDIIVGHPHFAEVSGPVGIAQAGASAAGEGWSMLLIFAAVISISLAIFNILPIPGLDGGRLLILLIEGVRKRPVSQRIVNGASLLGFAALILLMIIVTYHDIARLI